MLTRTCDRCKKVCESKLTSLKDTYDFKVIKYIRPYGDEVLDLCQECQATLVNWLNGENKLSASTQTKGYCPYFHEEPNYMNAKGVCWGTKEKEYCPYNGNEKECKSYPR